MKSQKDTLDVRYNGFLDEQSWILSPKKKVDVLTIPIEDSAMKVTFISSVDSLSFIVKVGDKHDFFIFNGKKNYHTRIEGIVPIFSKKDDSLAQINMQCLKTNRLSVVERNKIYPFNKATQVGLISFIDPITQRTIALPVKNGRLEQSKILERKILNTEEVDELTDISFNIGRTPVPNITATFEFSGAKCYEPRNGIIFINSKGHIFEYIEICFGCQRKRLSSKRIKHWDDCDQKYDILRSFFKKQGLQFGTETSEIF